MVGVIEYFPEAESFGSVAIILLPRGLFHIDLKKKRQAA
jgi:hypothetical protein